MRSRFASPVQAWLAGPRAGSDCSADQLAGNCFWYAVATSSRPGLACHRGCKREQALHPLTTSARPWAGLLLADGETKPISRAWGRGLHRGAEGFRACRRVTPPSQGGRADRMVCWSSICARPQATVADGANLHESERFENVVSEFDRVSAERASNPGYVTRQWPFCRSVEDCGRPEQDNLIDSYGRRRTSGNPNSLVHFHTGQKHAVSGRRSQATHGADTRRASRG